MHEIGIVEEVLSIIFEKVQTQRVKKVVLRIGKLSGVYPDAVRFGFDICSEGTRAEGAALEIIETAATAKCHACEKEFEIDQPYGQCICGSTEISTVGGDDLMIQKVEVAHV